MNKLTITLTLIITLVSSIIGNSDYNRNHKEDFVHYGCSIPINSDTRYWVISIDSKKNNKKIHVYGARFQSLLNNDAMDSESINLPKWTNDNGKIYIRTESSNDKYHDFNGYIYHIGKLREFEGYILIKGTYSVYNQLMLTNKHILSKQISLKCLPGTP